MQVLPTGVSAFLKTIGLRPTTRRCVYMKVGPSLRVVERIEYPDRIEWFYIARSRTFRSKSDLLEFAEREATPVGLVEIGDLRWK